MEKQIFKAGTYYIGDPGYIFDKSWDNIIVNLEPSFISDKQEINGLKVAIASTANGDGNYKDNYGDSYGVDSGLLGILPIELIKLDDRYTVSVIRENTDMHIHNFLEDFEVDVSKPGVFVFGNIVIDTNDTDVEEEVHTCIGCGNSYQEEDSDAEYPCDFCSRSCEEEIESETASDLEVDPDVF